VSNDEDVQEIAQVAAALSVSLGLFSRRLKQNRVATDATLPELMALVRLEREGPATPGILAAQEQITPQSMGATMMHATDVVLSSRSPRRAARP
jgi:hypothetical protein